MDPIILHRLHVMPRNDLSDLLCPLYDELRGVNVNNIGAIVSVEPYKADPDKPLELWRINPERTEGIERHFTRVFYANPVWKTALTPSPDVPPSEESAVQQIIIERASALSETLHFADSFLRSEKHQGLNLVTHSLCGEYFGPAVMLAIFSDQFPAASGEEIFVGLAASNHKSTKLASGELAFVDAATHRKGELIRTWQAVAKSFNRGARAFDVNDALLLHDRFREALDAHTAHLINAHPTPLTITALPEIYRGSSELTPTEPETIDLSRPGPGIPDMVEPGIKETAPSSGTLPPLKSRWPKCELK